MRSHSLDKQLDKARDRAKDRVSEVHKSMLTAKDNITVEVKDKMGSLHKNKKKYIVDQCSPRHIPKNSPKHTPKGSPKLIRKVSS